MKPIRIFVNRAARVGAALASGLALVLAGCGVPAPTAAEAPIKAPLPVQVAPATIGELRSQLTYAGELAPKYTVNVPPKVTGRIVPMNVDLGTAIKKREVIAQIEHTELDAQLAQAKANLQAAQAKQHTVAAQGRPEQVAQAQGQVDAAVQKPNALKNQGRAEQVAQAQAQ